MNILIVSFFVSNLRRDTSMNVESIINRNRRASWKDAISGLGIESPAAGRLLKAERSAEEAEICRVLDDVIKEWQEAMVKFEYVSEKDLVDYYTYRIKACEAKYAHFLNKAKEVFGKSQK